MQSIRVAAYLAFCVLLLAPACRTHVAPEEVRNWQEDEQRDFSLELGEVLDGLLGDEDGRISLEKKASVIPRCDVGERCAMKHGPRIGRLCNCLRGSTCNSFFLRCY